MEERAYLQELCSTVMAVDKNIRFAGVINSQGKLLLGQYRKDIQAPMIDSSPLNKSDSMKNSFLASYMSLSSLQKPFEPFLGQLNYQLTDYDKVKLVTIPLTDRHDLYLCASIDPVNNCQDIIKRILKSI